MPNTNPWSGRHCSRKNCITCNQESESENKPDCFKRNLVYENVCLECHPGAVKKGELLVSDIDVPSIYVGETSRSIFERSKEHWEGLRKEDNDNHMYKHWVIHHGSRGVPKFNMRVVKFHDRALSRQIGEAVRIRRRGALVLNSRSEYNRCSIQRLSLPQEDQKTGCNMDMGKEGDDKRLDHLPVG